MQENLTKVQNGLRILHPLMAGYIGREMSRTYHKTWWQEILLTLNDQWDLPANGEYDELIDSLDVANCLRIIDRKWSDVFKNKLDLNHRTWAKELMGVRNTVAHIGQKDMTQSDAERALDTMYRLCEAFDKEGADQIHELYQSVRYSTSNQSNKSISEGPGPIDVPISTRLGSDTSILDDINLFKLIGTNIVQKTTLTRKVTFAGKTEAYPVYKVRLDALFYNDQNDRISTWISKYKSEHGSAAFDKLKKNEYNNIIESFIYESNPESIHKTQKNISLIGQREPGVTLSDGRIVDGNRRYTCLRRIQRETKQQEVYFETVIMNVDIQTDRKQIKLLELAIQHGEEKKVDYDFIDYAIGTYNDIVETKLLTIDEYAESTGETASEVKKRIEIAEMICDFLDYIRLPRQYFVAREYQIYGMFQEMLPTIKQLPDKERNQLRTIVYNNIIMKALLDQRKYIRDIKMLIKNGTHTMYFDDMEEINKKINEKYGQAAIRSKYDIDCFARENESITEEMQLLLHKALLRSRRQQIKSKPAENVAKSVALMTEFDARTFDKLDESEKIVLRHEMTQLSSVLDQYTKMLTSPEVGDKAQEPSDSIAIKDQDESKAKPSMEQSLISRSFTCKICDPKIPTLLCKSINQTITSLAFSLVFSLVKENEKQNESQSYLAYFVNDKQEIISNEPVLDLSVGNDTKYQFVLNSNASSLKTVYLTICCGKSKADGIYRIIPFDLSMTFSADFGF